MEATRHLQERERWRQTTARVSVKEVWRILQSLFLPATLSGMKRTLFESKRQKLDRRNDSSHVAGSQSENVENSSSFETWVESDSNLHVFRFC